MTRHLKEAQRYGATAAIRAAAEQKKAKQLLDQWNVIQQQIAMTQTQVPNNPGGWFKVSGLQAEKQMAGSVVMGTLTTSAQTGPSTYGNLTNSTVDWAAMNVQALLQNQASASNADAVNTMRAAARARDFHAEKQMADLRERDEAKRLQAKLQPPHRAHREHHGKKR